MISEVFVILSAAKDLDSEGTSSPPSEILRCSQDDSELAPDTGAFGESFRRFSSRAR